MNVTTETVKRVDNVAIVTAGKGYNRPGEALCKLEDTGNGYIANFPEHRATHQDYYVCLDYAQAHDLIMALSAFKKELGFAE